jgi:hypothetical protein
VIMIKRTLLALTIILSCSMAKAATYYVATSGSDSANGSSGTPWKTPGTSMGKLNPGDTLIITAGTYVETSSYSFSKQGTASSPITITGQGGPIIDLQVNTSYNLVYSFSGSYYVMDGVKITSTLSGGLLGGALGLNGAVNCTFKNIEIYGISANLGGGNGDHLWMAMIQSPSAYNTFSNLYIHDIKDGDIFDCFGYTNRITSCTVSNCTNPNYGASAYHADFFQTWAGPLCVGAIVENNYVVNCGLQLMNIENDGTTGVHDNVFRNNVFVSVVDNPTMGAPNSLFYNNLFIDCGPNSAAIRFVNSGDFISTGSRVVNNAFIQYGISGYNSSIHYVDHNYFGTDSYGSMGTVGTAGISGGNPQFVGARNYRILAASVLRGAGVNLTGVSGAPTTDAAGNPRPTSGAWDIGPYQYGTIANTNPAISISPGSQDFGAVMVGSSNQLAFTVQNVGGGTLAGTASVSGLFSVISGGTYSLGSNQSQIVTIRYSPTVAGNHSQTVTFTGGGGGSAQVTGAGTAPPPSGANVFTFEAEAGVVSAPFTITSGYISQATQTTVPSTGGRAAYSFIITNGGNYVVQALVNAPNDAANSLFVNMDSEPQDPTMIWDMPVTAGFVQETASWRGAGTSDNNQFVPQIFNLGVGAHTLIIRGREPNVQLDKIWIFKLPPAPQNLHIVAGP